MKIDIKTINGVKKINNQEIEHIIQKLSPNDKEYILIKNICENVNSSEDLMKELKKLKEITTPASLMLYIKIIGNLSLIDAYPIFDNVME
jgi:hypothetical protein